MVESGPSERQSDSYLTPDKGVEQMKRRPSGNLPIPRNREETIPPNHRRYRSIFDLDNDLNLDRRAEWKAGDSYRRARVLSFFSKNFRNQLGRTVQNRRTIGEIVHAINETVYENELLDRVETSDSSFDRGKRIESRHARGFLSSR